MANTPEPIGTTSGPVEPFDTVTIDGPNLRFAEQQQSVALEWRLEQAPIIDIEAIGYSHISLICLECERPRPRGLRLMRARHQIRSDSSFADIVPLLRCAKCRQQANPERVVASKQRLG